MANTEMRAAASGPVTLARIPVWSSGRGPAKRRARQPRLALTPAGTRDSAHTTDNSSGVRVIDHQADEVAHTGTGSPASRRQIAIGLGSRVREWRRAIRPGPGASCARARVRAARAAAL